MTVRLMLSSSWRFQVNAKLVYLSITVAFRQVVCQICQQVLLAGLSEDQAIQA